MRNRNQCRQIKVYVCAVSQVSLTFRRRFSSKAEYLRKFTSDSVLFSCELVLLFLKPKGLIGDGLKQKLLLQSCTPTN